MYYPESDADARLHNGKFTDGDPLNDIPASRDSAEYYNMLFDELINLITGAGLTADEADRTQVLAAVQALVADAPMLGINQTWQNVTASRSASVTYTNSTARPIIVSVIAASASSTSFGGHLYVDGVLIAHHNDYSDASNYDVNVVVVVPPGSTYKFEAINTVSLSQWMELR